MKSFRENLRDELDYQGVTVKELAARAGIVKGSLDNYLGARNSIPSADVAVKIAKALNVSVEYLVTGEKTAAAPVSGGQKIREMIGDFLKISPPLQNSIRDLIHTAAQRTDRRGSD